MEIQSRRRFKKMERLKNGNKGEITMNENLSEMVKETKPEDMVFSEANLDIPEEEMVPEDDPQIESIGITSFSEWFDRNCEKFDNINQVKVAIRGVDSSKTLIMAVKDESGEKDPDGNDSRVLRVFENSDVHPILNLDGMDMKIYNNGFKVVQPYRDNIFIKCYGVKAGLIVVFCNNIDGKLIPYVVTRIKRKDEAVEVVTKNVSDIEAKLLQNADLESFQLLYKQSAKAIDQLTTNQDVVDWLLNRQNEVTDINHHLQIDSVIIDILS